MSAPLLQRSWFQSLLCLLVATAVNAAYFGGLLLTPQQTVPTFGGDGLTIHYNLQYHSTYGEGAALTSQYHPYVESVFMTDAHALLAVALAELRPWFPGLADYATGIAGGLIFWSNVLAVWVLFLVLRRLGVRWGLAIIGGLFVGMLSPQILRQLGGQYTLGFTWLLPLVIWYLVAWDDGKRYWLKSLGLTVVIYLLGLNNPYLYAIAGSFLLACGGLAAFVRLTGSRAFGWPRIAHWLGVFVATTLLVFLTLEGVDTVDDRVEVPFGFFHNIAQWGGLLTSQDVLLYDWTRRVLPGMAVPKYEHQLFLGLIPILTALALPFLLLVPALRRRIGLSEQPFLLVGLLAGLAGLVFGFGLPFSYFKEWTYEHLGAVLQFRAPVRFGWPLYYVLGLTAVFVLDRLLTVAADRKWLYGLVGLALVVWGVQVHQFLVGHLDDKFHGNPFQTERLAKVRSLAASAGIDTSTYSSIFLLPTELGWTDKVHHNGTWRSNHDGYQLSVATGLPLLNGKLSRLSLARCLLSLQMTTDPLVRKDLLDRLDTTKAILLLATTDDDLDPPERRLRDLGERVYQDKNIELLRLDPSVLHREHAAALAAISTDTLLTANYRRYAYEYNPDVAFFGAGSQRVGPNWQDLVKLPVDSLPARELDVSFWVYTDKRRFGGPKFYLRFEDAAGERISEAYQWTNTVYETQRGWQRVAFAVTVPPATATVRLISNYEHAYYVDELLLRPQDRNVMIDDAVSGQLYNNYFVRPTGR